MRTKRHLRPLIDAFSGLLECPKCICGRDSTPNTSGGAYSTPPDPVTCCPVSKNLFPALGLRPQISQCPRDKFLVMTMGSVSSQNSSKGSASLKRLKTLVNTLGVCVCGWRRNTGRVRWNYVVSNFVQVLASLFYMYYIFERFCIPVFRDFTSDFVTPRRLIVSIFSSILPGTLVLFIGTSACQ